MGGTASNTSKVKRKIGYEYQDDKESMEAKCVQGEQSKTGNEEEENGVVMEE